MTGESTAEHDTDTNSPESTAPDPLTRAYRHDTHKLFGRSHILAGEWYGDIRINEQVPLGADADAAMLSRPAASPDQTVSNHCTPHRLSLLTGSPPPGIEQLQIELPGLAVDIEYLLAPPNAERLHAEWLTDTVSAMLNESVYYPYTSLKYHTLLVAALLDNYRAGYTYGELSLVATAGAPTAGTEQASGQEALAAEAVCPHRTVCWTPALTLHITGSPGDRPSTPLGETPTRSFADVWSRLPDHPLDTDGSRAARLLDAQLRRIRSWSTALQCIEDVTRGLGPLPEWGESDA